ncbi:DciA family protein [Streptomyces sp. CC210A]|uniref:DciA family protein n=1 Tax=Streptomyces sp. CC210A TaxID=2898184 RepID=UPI001F30D06C|nr:DciA family protein [Streptomyces sp. CC210A]
MMNDSGTPELERPAWFGDTAGWWNPAFQSEDFAARVEPLGIDAQRRLHVLCESPAYSTQLRLIGKSALARINEIVPEARLSGLFASVRPRIAVLVVATDDFADEQLVADVLLETHHDVSEVFGPEHQVVLRLLGESAFDHQVERWAAAHTAATSSTSAPVYVTAHPADHAAHGEGAVWARDRALVAQGPQLCLAFCTPGAPLPAIARLATGAGVPVRCVRPGDTSRRPE